MYKSLDNLDVIVYENDDKLGDCKLRADVLKCADKVLKKMEDACDLQEAYFELVGINPRGSFATIVDSDIFEYLMRVELRKICPTRCYDCKLAVVEYGVEAQDDVMICLTSI